MVLDPRGSPHEPVVGYCRCGNELLGSTEVRGFHGLASSILLGDTLFHGFRSR